MKILITGASGHIGRTLAKSLSSTHELVLLQRSGSVQAPGTKVYQADLLEPSKLSNIVLNEKPDVIVHLAAMQSPECETNPSKAEKVNVSGTKLLAQLAKKAQVKRFIFASTAAVYSQSTLLPTDETSNINPASVYGQLKLRAEEVLREVAATSDTQFIILRFFNIYGPGFENSLINKLIASTPVSPVTLLGPDNFYRDYIHIGDVINSIKSCIDVENDSGFLVMNIASGIATSNAQLLNMMKKSGLSPYYNIQSSQANISWADIKKAQQIISFQPTKGLVFSGITTRKGVINDRR